MISELPGYEERDPVPAPLEDDESATVARRRSLPAIPSAVTASTPAPSTPEVDDAKGRLRTTPRPRRALSIGVAAVAVLAVVGGAIWATLTSVDQPETPPSGGEQEGKPDTSVDTEFPIPVRVDPPKDVQVHRLPDGVVRVSWTATEGLSYEVQRVDTSAPHQPLASVEGQVDLRDLGEDERPCVVVRALSEAGQLSQPSRIACASG